MTEHDEAIKQYLSKIASKGGKARAEKYDKDKLSEWGSKGGRPPKKGVKVEAKSEKSKRRL